MSRIAKAYLKEWCTGTLVEASLHSEYSVDRVIDADCSWRPSIEKRLAELRTANSPITCWPQHIHWDWVVKSMVINPAHEFFGIEYESETQGMMLTKIDQFSRVEKSIEARLVYVDYLTTAPWNDRLFVAEPRFGNVGTCLIRAAVELSYDQGFQGRIGLHSLPQSEQFYKRMGMQDLGADQDNKGLKYFELSVEQASILKKRGGRSAA